MTQIGSDVGAKDTLTYNIGKDLNIESAHNTYSSDSGTRNINASVTVGNNAVQANAGYNESSNRTNGTTNINSNITADNVIINTGNNATFAGANVDAGGDLTVNIGGDMTVESRQDTDYVSGDNFGINAGIGTGNAAGGFNTGNNNTDVAWVKDQTELTGDNVNINVGGKTTLTGGVIDGREELNLATGELAYNDIQDFNTSSETGFGINSGIGGNRTDMGEYNLHPSGSTTIGMTNKGSTTEQTTHATIGAGNITVGGDTNPELVGLNRDVDNSQEITRDEITGALDGSVTVDNRVFTESGRDQIADQHENLMDNIDQALKDAWNLPNTLMGAAWGLAGMTVSDNVTHYYDDENRVHIFENNPLGVKGKAATLGNVINFMEGSGKPTDVIRSYDYNENKNWRPITDNDRVIFLNHELKHRDQGQYLGPLFLPVYGISGGASSSNWMEQQADKAGNEAYKLQLNKGK